MPQGFLLKGEGGTELEVLVDGEGSGPGLELGDVGSGELLVGVDAEAEAVTLDELASGLTTEGDLGSGGLGVVDLSGNLTLGALNIDVVDGSGGEGLEVVGGGVGDDAALLAGVASSEGGLDGLGVEGVVDGSSDGEGGDGSVGDEGLGGLLGDLLGDGDTLEDGLVGELGGIELAVGGNLELSVGLIGVGDGGLLHGGGGEGGLDGNGVLGGLVLGVNGDAVVGGGGVDEELIVGTLDLRLELPLAGAHVVLGEEILGLLVEVLEESDGHWSKLVVFKEIKWE